MRSNGRIGFSRVNRPTKGLGKKIKEEGQQYITGLLGLYGSRYGIGIEIINKEERFVELGKAL